MPDSQPVTPRRLLLAGLVLFLASLALYGRAVGFDFVNFDDTTVLLAHPNLYDERSFTSSLGQIFVEHFPREEPLLVRDVSWALDARLFGHANPLGYHLGNVLLNGLNAALLFAFLALATRRLAFAGIVAGLFVVVPVHAEPVGWVMGRKDLLSTTWMLLALVAQTLELASPEPRTRRLLWATTLLLTLLALLSKISAVVLCVLLGLHRVFQPYLDGSRAPDAPFRWRESLAAALPRLAPHAALSVGIFLWYQGIVRDYGVIGWRGPDGLDPGHLATMARFAPLLLGLYVKHLVWPSQLSMFYRWPHVEIPLSPVEQAAAAAIALLAAGVLAILLWRRRDLAFHALAFGVLLVPYLGFAYVGFWSADRYLYLACFGLLALATQLGLELRARAQGAPLVSFGVVALALLFATASAVQTWRQLGVWRNNETLWTHEASLDAPSLLSLQALAKIHVRRAEAEPDPARRAEWLDRARAQIARGLERERAMGRQPSRYRVPDQLHLSRLHQLLGRIAVLEAAPVAEQLAHFERAYALAPDRANAMKLAGRYFDLAAGAEAAQREALVRRSFGYFVAFTRFAQNDPRLAAESRTLLAANYDEARFPYLAEDIRALRRSLAP